MNQNERRKYLISGLIEENSRFRKLKIPENPQEQKMLLRSLLNVRPAGDIDSRVLKVQDEYLQAELKASEITDFRDLKPACEGIYLWRGDITRLRCDAIVNAANSGMTGCYIPCHSCIDNCIHTYAGMQLRQECSEIMEASGGYEPAGGARITSGYNLPCDYIIHTVGPAVDDKVTDEDRKLLASCYRSCLALADENGIKSIAFCCISTGVFRFPAGEAAGIAVKTVRNYRKETGSSIEVVFNVFKESDEKIYKRLLCAD